MKIVSWNCHYGLDSEKFGKIMTDSTFGDVDGDDYVYAFQEVLENEFLDIANFKQADEYKYRHWYGDHEEYGDYHIPRGAEGDLGIVLISKTYKIQRFDQGRIKFRYVVPYVLTDNENENKKFILIHVWTKSKPDGYIKPIYDALEYYKEQFENEGIEKIVMLGDFNFGIDFENNQHKSELEKIEEMIEKKGLKRDDKFTDCKTFRYARNGKFYFNDCIYTTENITVNKIEIGNKEEWIESNLSDHCPIMAELEI